MVRWVAHVWEPRVPFRFDLASPPVRAAVLAMVPLVRAARAEGMPSEDEFYLCLKAFRRAAACGRSHGRLYSKRAGSVGEVERLRVTAYGCLLLAHAIVAAEGSDA